MKNFKIFFATASFIFLCHVSHAQYLKYYQNNYIDPQVGNTEFQCITLRNGEPLIAGVITNPLNNHHAIIIEETDVLGNFVYEKVLELGTDPTIPITTTGIIWEGGPPELVTICGYVGTDINLDRYGFILQYNYSSKTINWSKILTSPHGEFFDIAVMPA